MSQDEGDSLGGRLGRYARVGSSVGGLAVKLAGQRYLGWSLDRDKHATELKAALGGLKGPLMKAAQLIATIPDALPPEYARELAQLQANAPAMGWAFVRRRMATELGPDWQSEVRQVRQGGLVRRLAGPGPSRDAARRHRGRVQAAVSRHGVGAGGRPQPAEAGVRDRPALRSRHPHRRDPCRDHHAPARGARLPARGQARRALPPHAARRGRRARARGRAVAFDRPAAHHDLAAGRAAAQLEEPFAGGQGPARHPHVPRLVRAVLFLRRDPRRSASRQLHGAARRLGEPDGFRLRADLPAALRARLDRALSCADDRRPWPAPWRPTRIGASPASAAR